MYPTRKAFRFRPFTYVVAAPRVVFVAWSTSTAQSWWEFHMQMEAEHDSLEVVYDFLRRKPGRYRTLMSQFRPISGGKGLKITQELRFWVVL